MEHRNRALIALSFSGMAFLALFHAYVIRQVYPGYSGQLRVLAPLVAGTWSVLLIEAWQARERSAPFLALGCFAALGYGFWLASGGAALVGTALAGCAAIGLVNLGQGYFLHLNRPQFSGELPGHLLNHAGGEETAQLRKTR